MIRVETLNLTDVRMKARLAYFDAGYGPTVFENTASSPTPPGPSGNGLVWGAGNYLIWGSGNYLIWGT